MHTMKQIQKRFLFFFPQKNKKKMKEILNEQLCISNPGVLVSNKHTKQKENRDNVSNYGKNTHESKCIYSIIH